MRGEAEGGLFLLNKAQVHDYRAHFQEGPRPVVCDGCLLLAYRQGPGLEHTTK